MIFRRFLPIVVGGCHRSGTTLVRRILNSHPHVFCGPEVKFFRDLYGHYLSDDLGHLRFSSTVRTIADDKELLREWGCMYLRLLRQAARRENKRRWADKNPENVLYLPQWDALLGRRWLYVHVVRNPLDTLASIQEVGFPLTIPSDVPGRIEHIRRYMETGLDFVDAHPERAFTVVYERLVSDPKNFVAALMRFLGERPVPQQLDFAAQKHAAGIEDPKIAATGRIHSASIGRWKNDLAPETIEEVRAALLETWQRVDPGGDWLK